MRRRAGRPASVLFLQSGARYAADAQVHATLMRLLPDHGVETHALCVADAPNRPSETLRALSAIPGLRLRHGRFGPVVTDRRPLAVAAEVVRSATPTVMTLGQAVRLVRRRRLGVVHCTEKAREAALGYLIARLGGAALVVHLHVKVESWYHPISRWVMRRADRLVAVSEFVAGSARAEGYRDDRIVVVLNGMSPRHPGAPGERAGRSEVRSSLGVPEDRAVVCIAARMIPWKGHRELIEALAASGARQPYVLLVLGGDATDERGGLRAELEALVGRLGLGDRVRFLGFREDAAAIIAAADVYAMPSYEEPFGLVFLEAMDARLPVVALDNGGTPEVVEHGVTGLLAAPGDRGALAAHLATVLDDPALRSALGDAGRRRLGERFGSARMCADMAAVYQRLAVRGTAR